jgi:iron complex outermembrane receptor protein
MIRTTAAILATTTCLVAFATPVAAQTREYNVPAGSLRSALDAFARQSGRQVMYRGDEVRSARSPGVRGTRTADDAFNAIVAGSGFVAKMDRSGAFAVVKGGNGQAGDNAPSGEEGPSDTALAENGSAEIVVTAQKRRERLVDVPVPVTALSSTDLVQENLVRLADYARRIPGLTVAGNELDSISIRGINAGSSGTNPTVAVTLDDLPVSNSMGLSGPSFPDIDPADLSRVEVLRGPQGTLYGASSLGGLIKLVTRTPDTKDFSGRVEIGGSKISDGGYGWQGRASVNIPVWEDRLGIRLSAFRREDPRWLDNINPGYAGKDVNTSRTEGWRAALVFKPIDDLTINASYLRQTIETQSSGTVRVTPYPTDYRPLNSYDSIDVVPGSAKGLVRVISLKADYELPFATLSSVSGWSKLTNNSSGDVTQSFPFVLSAANGLGPLFPNAPAGSSVSLDNVFSNRKFSQEVRLASDPAAAFSWLIGGFYTNENPHIQQTLNALDPGGDLLGLVVGFPVPLGFKEKAVFGSVAYKFTDQFDVQVGGRYSRNEQTFQQNQITGPAAVPLFGPSQPDAPVFTSEDDSFTWLVTPRYRFNDDMMIYGRFATGYRPGGPNTTAAGGQSFRPDSVTNYEVGLKGYLLDRKVTVDASLFWIDWKDIQLAGQTAAGLNILANGGAARSRGVEFSGEWRLGSGWSINGNATYTDAALTQAIVPPTPTTVSVIGPKGTQLPITPKFASNLGVDKLVQLANGWRLNLGANWTHVGNRNSLLRSAAPAAAGRRDALRMPAYEVVDMHATLTDGAWEATIFARNIGNGRGIVAISDGQGLSPATSATFLQPRTIGVIVARNF